MFCNLLIFSVCCGETGIRTLGTVTRSPHFECGPIDHSGISPKAFLLSGRKYTIYSIILIWKIHFFLSTCPPPPCRHAYPLQNALQGRLACSHPPCKHTCGGENKGSIIAGGCTKKSRIPQECSRSPLRRGRDSNPRSLSAQQFSRLP